MLWKEHFSGEAYYQGGGVLLVETVRNTGLGQAIMTTSRLCVLLGEVL